MRIGCIGGRNLNILPFCYVLLQSLDKSALSLIRSLMISYQESYDLLSGVL